MATTSDLVEALVADLAPAPKAWVVRRLAVGFLAGAAGPAALVLWLWGLRPDLAAAVGTWPFWTKFAYTGLLAGAGLIAVQRLARPGGRGRLAISIAIGVVAIMACLAALQLAQAPAAARRSLVMGATAASCPWLIMALAVPIFAGGIWAVRAMAPTRLAHAGAAVGLAAGAIAAFVYAVSCDESAMPFVLVWYGLGMAVPVMAGALTGRRLLRW